jgi:polysaccharide export outer membrane protein
MKIKTVFLFFFIGTIFTPLSEAADYKITVGDKLRISVWGNPNLDDQVTVRPDGKISFDLIGEVKAEGLKPLELKKIITVKLAEFIKDPEVTVKLIGTDMFRIYVMGPLPGVGEKSIRGSTFLMQFLSTMMPIPDEIDLKKSYLIRDNKRLDLDFYELLINDNLEYNVPLQSNDTIVFKEKEKTVIEEELL